MRIIVAGEDPEFVAETRNTLAAEGHEVSTTLSGGQVVKMLLNTPDAYDCLVMDLHMHGLDGIHTLCMVRKVSPKLPVVMVCADGCLKSEIVARCSGADALLKKPFGPEDISAAVLRAFEKKTKKETSPDAACHIKCKGETKRNICL